MRQTYQTYETPIPRRAGAAWELAALGPFPPRYDQPLWALDRAPFEQDAVFALGGRLGKVQFGTDPNSPVTGTAAATTGPRAPAARNINTTPRTMGFTLNIDLATTAGFLYAAVSTPPIPWPFRIVQCIVRNEINIGGSLQWNLCATDSDYTGNWSDAIPGRLIQPYINIGAGNQQVVEWYEWGPIISDSPTVYHPEQISGGVVGRTIEQSNQFLTFAIRTLAAGNGKATQCIVSVEEIRVPTNTTSLASAFGARVPAPVPLAPKLPTRQAVIGAPTTSAPYAATTEKPGRVVDLHPTNRLQTSMFGTRMTWQKSPGAAGGVGLTL